DHLDVVHDAGGAHRLLRFAGREVPAAAGGGRGHQREVGTGAAAAGEARRHAGEATRAANAAVALADRSATAANEARDAANSAADHAEKAAVAADEAAQHAGDAATAAAKSTAHANAATQAANAATAAVAKAKTTFDLAREIEAQELAARTAAAIEQAKDLKTRDDERLAEINRARQEAKDLDAEAIRLAAEANQPGADPAQVATKGRKVAVLAMKTRGPWSRLAAEVALASDDKVVTDYVRTEWKSSAERDEFGRVEQLATVSEVAPVRTAAESALDGTPAQIKTFLEAGQHQAAIHDYGVQVTQIVSAAPGRGVKDAGQAALNAGNAQALRDFITTGQYVSREQDDRVRAVQLVGSGTPEVKAAARIAMEGSREMMRAFVDNGQYMAQRKDHLAATHVQRVQGLIAGASLVAARAQIYANEAQRVAAVARKAAADAEKYKNAAAASAKEADGYAAQANQSAKDAEASAAQAAQSAKVARNAEASAHRSARQAGAHAARAEGSAASARGSASAAWASANTARADAIKAGKDAATAAVAAVEALVITVKKYRDEREAARRDAQKRADTDQLQKMEDEWQESMKEEETDWWDTVKEGGHLALDGLGLVPVFGEVADGINCGWYGAEGDTLNASLSCAAMVPFFGWGATGGKLSAKGANALEAYLKSQRARGMVPNIWSDNPRKGLTHAGNAVSHWSKHKGEFSELNNAKEYVQLAHSYGSLAMMRKYTPGYRIYDQGNGRLALYDEKRNIYAAYTDKGVPQTMYKPRPYDRETNPGGYQGSLEDWLNNPGRGTQYR
ncbi:hypothetical protein ACFVIM_02360, partial [Streptomyces sp. NPDC057638]|uniref:hypothetical protein n=1 Tax=Streptomyces sp. NPDC057638 TaxID=3346190 RepID=UPI0036ACF564